MTVNYLPLCSTPKNPIRDGYVGTYAKILLPFYSYGYWFRGGMQMSTSGSDIVQDQSLGLNGTVKDLTFQKDCCTCYDV